jgi:biotin carboxyl carrier protein
MHEMVETEISGVPDVTSIRERVVIAPRSGRFHPHPPEIFTAEGEWACRGQVLGEVRNGGEATPITSAFEGWVMGMLAVPGQPVGSGDPLFWIRT